MNLIRHVLLILVSLFSLVFAYFLKIICFIHVVLLQPACVASCACGVGGPSSGSGGDGEGGEECATGAQ